MSLKISKPWLFGLALPFALIVCQVLVDLAFGALGTSGRAGLFSIGVVIRGGLVAIAIVLLLQVRAPALKGFLLLMAIIFLLSNIVWLLSSEVYGFAHEIGQGLRLAFPWLMVGIFLYLDRQTRIDPFYLLKLIAWAGFLSGGSLLVATLLGFAGDTYGSWSYGSKGLFYAQNDIGLALIISLVAAVVLLTRTRSLTYLVVTATIASAGLMLGTRTGVLGPVAVVLAFAGATLLNRRLLAPTADVVGWRAKAVLAVPLILTLGVGAVIFTQSERTEYLTKRIEALAEGTPRSKLEAAGMARITERGLLPTLFGDGGLAFKKAVAENLNYKREKIDLGAMTAVGESKRMSYPMHRVENDIVDTLGFYGVALFAVVYAALALVCLLALRRAIRDWNIENVGLLLMLSLFLGHSSLAGHGLFSAQVATVIAPVLFLLLRDVTWQPARERRAATGRPAWQDGPGS